MDPTFREKNLRLVGLSLVLVFGFYFSRVLPARAPDVLPGQIALLVGAVSRLIALQIAGHALIAALDRPTKPDERDRVIGLIGERNGSFGGAPRYGQG